MIGVLLAFLLPVLSNARRAGYSAVCANNLRQLSVPWLMYVQDHNDRLPRHAILPEWKYGGLDYVGPQRAAIFSTARPLNQYIDQQGGDGVDAASALFRCPADLGVFQRGTASSRRAGGSVLPNGSCFAEYGTSYRANEQLLDASAAGIDDQRRPLALHEITATHSRVLLMGDPVWYFRAGNTADAVANLEASWHGAPDAGNMLAVDGSVRFTDFATRLGETFDLRPRP